VPNVRLQMYYTEVYFVCISCLEGNLSGLPPVAEYEQSNACGGGCNCANHPSVDGRRLFSHQGVVGYSTVCAVGFFHASARVHLWVANLVCVGVLSYTEMLIETEPASGVGLVVDTTVECFRSVYKLALVTKGDHWLLGIFNNNETSVSVRALGSELAVVTAYGVCAWAPVVPVVYSIVSSVSHFVFANTFNIHVVGDVSLDSSRKSIGTYGTSIDVRERSFTGNFLRALDLASGADGILHQNSADSWFSGVSVLVFAVVDDVVVANLCKVHNITANFDVFVDPAVNTVRACGTIVDVVVVVVGLESHVVGANDGDDWLGVVFVDDGTAFLVGVNLSVAWLVLAYVLQYVCANLEGLESFQSARRSFVGTTLSLATANLFTVAGLPVKGHFNILGQITSTLVFAPEGFFGNVKTVDNVHVFLVSGRVLDLVKVVDATVVL